MESSIVNYSYSVVGNSTGIDWASWITALSTLLMMIATFFAVIIAYQALSTWKKETKYKHLLEFITTASIIIEDIDEYFNNGYYDESVISKTNFELNAWAPFWNNEANRYSENIINLYRNLLKEKNYLYSFNKSTNEKYVNDVCNCIKEYKDSMNMIVSAKMNLCHLDIRIRQASINIIKDKSKTVIEKQKKAKNIVKKARNKLL